MNPYYPLVAERAAHRCEYCHAPELIFNVPFEVDHIIPISKGGSDDPSNLAPLL
jgi:5-methylcytosine-specific restriction endonuclease McrA